MKYIIKFTDFTKVTEISNLHKLRVLSSLPKLKMIVFEHDPLVDDVNLTKLRTEPSIKYVQLDEVVSLDVEESQIEVSSISKKKLNSQFIQDSTFVGMFPNGPEYYSHLELLNSDDYTNTSSHEFGVTKDGDGVDIFIFDTGVNFNHPLLTNRVNRVPNFNLNLDSVSDSDNNGHGTKSALMAAGVECGVATKSRIYSLKVLKESGSGSFSDIAIAMNAVITFTETTNRPSIANLSLGTFPTERSTYVSADQTGYDNLLNDGCKALVSSGIHTLVAAGNGFYGYNSSDDQYSRGPMLSTIGTGSLNLTKTESNNFDPGQGDVVVVGATQTKPGGVSPTSDPTMMASFSNYGQGNTINTPGNFILGPKWTWTSGVDNNNYSLYNGTSFACPIVAGLMALRLQDKPSEVPSATKQWLIETARKNKIKNLAKNITFDGSKLFKWNSEQGTLTIIIQDTSSIKFSEILTESSGLFQYDIDDSNILIDDYINWKQLIYNFNDGWWEWSSEDVTDYSVTIKPRLGLPTSFINGSEIEDSGVSFDVGLTSDLICANLTSTHEETDGVKGWQTEDAGNVLTGSFGKIYTVEYTDNLCAFNPYQSYAFQYNNGVKPKLYLPEAFNDSPLKKVSFKTNYGEAPINATVTIKNTLDGISVSPDGDLISTGFLENPKDYALPNSVLVEFTNGYETFTDTLEVIDNTESYSVLKDNKNFIWYGMTGTTETFNLRSESNIKTVHQILIDNAGTKIRTYSKEIPDFVSQPFTELCPGFGYYVILEPGAQDITIPNSIVSGSAGATALIS